MIKLQNFFFFFKTPFYYLFLNTTNCESFLFTFIKYILRSPPCLFLLIFSDFYNLSCLKTAICVICYLQFVISLCKFRCIYLKNVIWKSASQFQHWQWDRHCKHLCQIMESNTPQYYFLYLIIYRQNPYATTIFSLLFPKLPLQN